MRSATNQFLRWDLGHFGVGVKVEIDRTGSGAWVDLTSLQSRDWVREVSLEDSIDSPTMTATITLERSAYLFSLAPLMTTSALNVGGTLATLYRKVRIWSFNSRYGTPFTNAAANFTQLWFSGRVFSVDWAGDAIKLECRDFGGDLMDATIETDTQVYGSSSGVLAETVMQQILTAQTAVLPGAVTLYSITGTSGTPWNPADSPAWAIREFSQSMMPVYAALQVIAQQIGWLLKYRFNASVGDFVLTWYDPARGALTPLRTFTASQYTEIQECSLHLADIRNVVRACYYDTAGHQQNVTASDATSITNYGRRFMQIAEEATSQINTSIEAQKMADAAVLDLALPTMTHTVEMPLFWAVEPGDVYTFAANNVHYDLAQTLAVIGYRHTINASASSTAMTLRGKPSGGVQTWFEREVRRVRKQFGAENFAVSMDEANLCPNGSFLQYTRG